MDLRIVLLPVNPFAKDLLKVMRNDSNNNHHQADPSR